MIAAFKEIDGKRMRTNFSTHAGQYERYAAVQKRVVTCLSEAYLASAPRPGRVLDVGTGTGALGAAIGGVRPDCPLTLIDIAHGMSLAAHRRLPGSTACDADAHHLPFAAASFSNVVSSSVYQWVADLPQAFGEVARVLRPRGCFALAMFGEQTLGELRDSHRQAVAEMQSDRASHVQEFVHADEVGGALASAGFACERLLTKMEVEHYRDVPDLLRQLKRIGAGNASTDRPRGLASRRVLQRMVELYEERHRTAEGLPATYEVIVAISRKR